MEKKNNTVFGSLLGIFSTLILIGGLFLATKSQPQNLVQSSDAKVEVLGESLHDWGNMDINGGLVEKVFQIRNAGTSDLEITNFKTSCMCTEVRANIEGKGSPVFGMHTTSGWAGVIEPGEEAEITVVFDPMFHGPMGTGPITRLVSFHTNDVDNAVMEFRLKGNVVRLEK